MNFGQAQIEVQKCYLIDNGVKYSLSEIIRRHHELTVKKLVIRKISAVYRERSSTLGRINNMIRLTIIGNVEAVKKEVPLIPLSSKPKFL
jgi:hypothetical protein